MFLIVNETQFLSMQHCFKDMGFKVCEHPFNILYDMTTMIKRKSSDFPHRHSYIALIAKTQERLPNDFVPDFAFPAMTDSRNECTPTFASFVNVENYSTKLKAPNAHG